MSLTLHRVESYHAGEYTCYDAYQCLRPRHLCEELYVSVLTCTCSLTEVTAGMDTDRVTVKCILEGYRSPRNSNISVNISPGGGTVQGIVQENYLLTDVEAARLCTNLTMEFNLNPRFPYNIQCQVPRINSCPNHGSTGIPPGASSFQAHAPQTTWVIKYRTSSSPVISSSDGVQYHTSPSSKRITGKETITYHTSSFSVTSGYESIQHRSSLSTVSITGGKIITFHTRSSSKFKKHVLITSITVVIVSIIVAVVIVCLIRRRNERNHVSSCRKPGTKQPAGEKTDPASSVGGKRDQSVDRVNETSDKARSGQAYYFKESKGAHYEENDSRMDWSCNVTDNRITKPTTTQPFYSTQISKDAKPFSSHHQILDIQESSNSCSQYESVDAEFHKGTEADDNMAGRCVGYQELILGPSDLSSQYQPLHLYEGTGRDVPFVTHQHQFIHESSDPFSQYEAMDFPLTTDEAENGDTHFYAACDEKPQPEKERVEESSKGSIDEPGIHVYANLDKRPRYGRNRKP